jgi:hypothetical protein
MDSGDLDGIIGRLTALEDRLAIMSLLAGSAYSSDTASEPYWSAMFAEDAVLDRGGDRPVDRGRADILKVVNSANQHDAIAHGMAHFAALPHVTLDGDSAVAVGYLLVIVPDANAPNVDLPGKGTSPGLSVYQLTVNRWDLARGTDGWVVTKRIVRPLASGEATQLLRGGMTTGS